MSPIHSPPSSSGPISISAVMYWLDTSPRDATCAAVAQRTGHGDRQAAVALARDSTARRAQRSASCSSAIGRARSGGSPSIVTGPGAERRQRGDEARGRAGEPGVSTVAGGVEARRPLPATTAPTPPARRARRRGAQAFEHRHRVVAVRARRELAVAFGERGDDQRPVGDALRPGTSTVASSGARRAGRTANRRSRVSSGGVTAGWKPRSISPPRYARPTSASTRHDRDTEVALGEVDDLEAGDVDAVLGGEREDLGRRTEAVGDRDADLGQLLGVVIRLGRLRPAVRARCRRPRQRVAVDRTDDVTHLGEPGDQAVEGVDDGRAVLVADVEPDVGMAAGDAGHVPEPAGGEAQQGGVLVGAVGGQAHQAGRGRGAARGSRRRPSRRGARGSSPPSRRRAPRRPGRRRRTLASALKVWSFALVLWSADDKTIPAMPTIENTSKSRTFPARLLFHLPDLAIFSWIAEKSFSSSNAGQLPYCSIGSQC